MQLERKALYNLLKYQHPDEAKSWQKDDLRQRSLPDLFARLKIQGLSLNETSFRAFAEECDSPEDFVRDLLDDPQEEDQIFLLVFELWRRLLPTKRSFSLLADELDEQIHHYNAGLREDSLLTTLYLVIDALQRGLDQGLSREECQNLLEAHTAYDVEGFLYDYIQETLEQSDLKTASDLLEAFDPFVKDEAWFSLLSLDLLIKSHPDEVDAALEEALELATDLEDGEFSLELLSLLVHFVRPDIFLDLAQETLSFLETEDQLQELLSLLAHFWHSLDKEAQEAPYLSALKKRCKLPLERSLSPQDRADILQLLSH